jgi:tyrosinase
VSETLLRYWREDPLLNEHHEHWHLVYPYAGRADPDKYTEKELQDIADGKIEARYQIWHQRHGELFVYMHAQLLARYAAERLSIGLPAVVPFDDYRQPIKEGYFPGLVIKSNYEELPAGDRPDNTSLKDIKSAKFSGRPGARVSSQEQFRDRLLAAVATASAPNRPSTISEFGERVEATDRLAAPYFGSLHNDGHLLISMHDDNPNRPGCMHWEAAAVRDPVFFRWHAHIDDLFRKYQDTLDPYGFSDLPSVEARNLTVISSSGQKNELLTEMRIRNFRPANPVAISYLSHEDFTYQITAVNNVDAEVPVTVRIFMAPEKLINDRRAWIEMDKFRHILPVQQSTFTRHSRSSSVIRHPVWTAEMLENPSTGPNESGASPGCRCGWPYTLLLPRGKPGGMKFRFLVLLTPGSDLSTDLAEHENSSSYCGLVDSEYPDERAMGYPFDRRFNLPLKNWISGRARPPQVTTSVVNIKHVRRALAA